MSDQRPASLQGRQDEARLLHAAARERLAVVSADLAQPECIRLNDWQRTTASALNAKLIRTVEDEVRSYLLESEAVRSQEALAAAFGSAHVEIAVPLLEQLSAIDSLFVSILMRRTEEHCRSRSPAPGESPLLVDFIRDKDPAVAGHAMAVLIAQSRRVDSFSEPAAARTELPAELEHKLVWRVSAALRHYMVGTHGMDPAVADAAIVAAAGRLLAGYDEGDVLEARAMRLARRLDETGRLTDEFIERALAEGSLALFVAGLAARTALSHASAWEVLSDPRGRGAVFLLKAAEVDRPHAAAILLMLAAAEEEVPPQVDLFDVTGSAAARDALRLWQVDSGYRAAIAELAA